MEDVLPPLVEKYGEQLEIFSIEISDPVHYVIYLEAVKLFKVAPERQGVPSLYIADTHLFNSNEISDKLPGLVKECFKQGGVGYPAIPGLADLIGGTAEQVEPAETVEDAAPIYLAYFYQVGCQDCDRVKGDLNYLKSKYPQLVVEEYNVRDDGTLSEWLGERAGVPTRRRLTAPTVFVGDDYLLEEDLEARTLQELFQKYTPGGAERVWENWEETAEQAERSIVERFKSWGVLPVVSAGLLDGLNPCAFATLVFFVSYLSISGRQGKEILSVGAAFTFGVFLAYVLVGLGFYHVLGMFDDLLTTLGRWVYGLTAVFCLGLAVFSLLDYFKARRGDVGDMSLNLPHGLRMRINATIRKSRKSQAFVAAAFVTGIVVSFLELACTGQVYLPTIILIMSMPDLRAQATLYLFIYNVLFVAPLVVVFVMAYYGTGAKQLSDFLQRRASTVKLGMFVLFLGLGSWLVSSLL
jgi:cytochrome c biogenesis protein CcdA